jgi:dihydroflavonol-4-reductase
MSVVLVTGASGFVAAHVIDQLLNADHSVRATVRSESKKSTVRDMLHTAGTRHVERLSFVLADLLRDEGWAEACHGCDYVMHVASPMTATNDPDAVIKPAVDGVLRVLKAARAARVKWQPRAWRDTIVGTAESLFALGIVK